MRCKNPIFGNDITIRKNGFKPLGFYSIAIKTVGSKEVSFSDIAQFKKSSISTIDGFYKTASRDMQQGGGYDNYNYWNSVKSAYEYGTLNAVLRKLSWTCVDP